MKTITRSLLCLLALLIASPALAADDDAPAKKKKGGKGPQASAAMMKKLESLDLTAEQKDQLEGAAKTLNAAMKSLREEGFTPDLAKQKAEAMKKAREEGKKGPNVESEVLASLNLTEEQQAMLKKAAEAQTVFQKSVAKVLTEEQLGQLPDPVKQQLMRAKGGQGKKKKAA